MLSTACSSTPSTGRGHRWCSASARSVRAGTFPMTVSRENGSATVKAVATTTEPDQLVDAVPSPDQAPDGTLRRIRDGARGGGGVWRLVSVNCNGALSIGSQPVTVDIMRSSGAACVFENRFVPEGSITIEKVTRGGVGTLGFLIASEAEPPGSTGRSATTVREAEPVTATGVPARALPLGPLRDPGVEPRPTANGATVDARVGRLRRRPEAVRPGPGRSSSSPLSTLTSRAIRQRAREASSRPPEPSPTPSPSPPPPGPRPEPATGVADLVITKRPLRRRYPAGRLVGFELTVRNVGGSRPGTSRSSIVRGREPATLLAPERAAGSRDDRALLASRIGTLEPGNRARVLVRVRATTARSLVNLAVVDSSTQETRLRNNLPPARVRVVVVGAPRDGCASAAGRGTDGPGRSTSLALLTRREGSSPRRAS